ncbi:MAG: isochorismatase [Caldilineaceae bacterium]|nr:isochorismatase [Caldilineaceae bacterium]
MYQPLPLPPHYEAEQVGQVWRVPYEERARAAEQWAAQHSLKPAASDSFRVALLAIDVQNTFCLPDFELYVGGRSGRGAVEDNRRLCEFIYRNLGLITQVFPTLDTHQAAQIFHAIFFVNDAGEHPAPLTQITVKDIEEGVWRFNADLAGSLGLDAAYVQRHLMHYTSNLASAGRYDLTIWPYHAMLGSIGHALVPAFEEALFFHGIARRSQPDIQIKGAETLTEHYSALGPEVSTGPDGEQLGSFNRTLLEKLRTFDAVLVAGQAKSHCVAWTVQHLLDGIQDVDPGFVERIYLLEDCTSPVVVPGVVDFTDQAEAAFDRFAGAGMHRVCAIDPVETWLLSASPM